jgi:hypothetical protein
VAHSDRSDSENAAAQAEQQALGEHLPLQTGARGSQGQTNGHVALPAGGLGKQQIGDIGSGNRQHQEHNHRERGQKENHPPPFMGRQCAGLVEREPVPLVGFRIGHGEALGQRDQLCRGLRSRNARLQPAHDSEPMVFAGRLRGEDRRQLAYALPSGTQNSVPRICSTL